MHLAEPRPPNFAQLQRLLPDSAHHARGRALNVAAARPRRRQRPAHPGLASRKAATCALRQQMASGQARAPTRAAACWTHQRWRPVVRARRGAHHSTSSRPSACRRASLLVNCAAFGAASCSSRGCLAQVTSVGFVFRNVRSGTSVVIAGGLQDGATITQAT
jgi:hypothetical protein